MNPPVGLLYANKKEEESLEKETTITRTKVNFSKTCTFLNSRIYGKMEVIHKLRKKMKKRKYKWYHLTND
jgi:tRNA 2-selenouridine synthase SelU